MFSMDRDAFNCYFDPETSSPIGALKCNFPLGNYDKQTRPNNGHEGS